MPTPNRVAATPSSCRGSIRSSSSNQPASKVTGGPSIASRLARGEPRRFTPSLIRKYGPTVETTTITPTHAIAGADVATAAGELVVTTPMTTSEVDRLDAVLRATEPMRREILPESQT